MRSFAKLKHSRKLQDLQYNKKKPRQVIFFKLDNLDERVEIQYLHSKGLASMNIQTDMVAKHGIGAPLFATMNDYVS